MWDFRPGYTDGPGRGTRSGPVRKTGSGTTRPEIPNVVRGVDWAPLESHTLLRSRTPIRKRKANAYPKTPILAQQLGRMAAFLGKAGDALGISQNP